jgi:hypothetical protein
MTVTGIISIPNNGMTHRQSGGVRGTPCRRNKLAEIEGVADNESAVRHTDNSSTPTCQFCHFTSHLVDPFRRHDLMPMPSAMVQCKPPELRPIA